MYKYLSLDKNNSLRYKKDLVENPKAIILINHGFAEHIGRYDYVTEFFVGEGFSVYRYDLRGHGRSKTRQGYIESYEDFISDCDKMVELIRSENKGLDIFMLGHSMGGLVTCMYGISHPGKLKGQIFSGPAVNTLPPVKGVKGKLLSLMGSIFPNKTMRNVVEDDICSVESVVVDYKNDPDVLRKASFKFLKEFLIEGPKFVRKNIKTYKYPCLICHGEEDRVVPVEVGEYLYNNIGSKDKTFKVYKGLYHEILNEDEKNEILETMVDWMNQRL